MYVPPQLKYTEIIILETLGVFFENLSLQRLVISHGILDMLTRSLLRAKVQPGVKFMDDSAEKEWVDIPTLDQIVTISIDILYCCCDLPEGQMYIASNTPILHHFFNILVNPGFNTETAVFVVDMMVQVANLTSSHGFLTQRTVIKTLLGVPYCQFDPNCVDDSKYAFLSKYCSLQCIAKLLLISPIGMVTV